MLVWVGSAWLLGLTLGSFTSLKLWQWFTLALGAALSAIAFRQRQPFRSIFLLQCVLFLGAARWVSGDPRIDLEDVAFYSDTPHQLVLTGQIATDPERLDNQTRLEIQIERIWIPDLKIQKPVEGLVLVIAPPFHPYEYGERLKITGFLETPPQDGDFSYRQYLARQGILTWIPEPEIRPLGMGKVNPLLSAIYRLRNAALDEVYRLFPFPEAPLIAGITLGIESFIPEDLSRAYSTTGTTHIIAISGFNITIMAGLAIAFFGRSFGRVRGLILAGVLVLLYTLFVGGDAPVVRAAIMGLIALLARYLGRRTHGLSSLAAAAICMTCINPRAIQDVGFQLSFFATLGLILYADPLSKLVVRIIQNARLKLDAKRWGNALSEMLLFTLAAQITTLPVIAWHFQKISIISLLANALILPLQPLLMILSGLATMLGLIWHPLGQIAAWFAWPFSSLTNRLVTLMATIPGGVLYSGQINPAWLLIYYLILLFLTVMFSTTAKQKLAERVPMLPRIRLYVRRSTILLFLTLANILLWNTYSRLPDGFLHASVLDVGRGEAILIRTPSGGTVLINGGSSPLRLATELGHHLPYPDRQIDWLLIAGTQYHQIAGFREIASMADIQQALTVEQGNGRSYQRVIDQLLSAEIPLHTVQQGQRFNLGDGAWLEILTSGHNGFTLLLKYGHARLLFPIGLSPVEIPELLADPRTADLTAVLMADGGYVAVNPANLLSHFNAKGMVISCQIGDCPLQDNAQDDRHQLLQTAIYGSIEMTTDGQSLWLTSDTIP